MKKFTKLISAFILLFFISNCAGYEPIFKSSNLKFVINNHKIIGDKKIGKQIFSKLKRISDNNKDAFNELGGGSQSHEDIDTTERSLVIDLTKLSESKTPESVVINRYLKIIQVKRQDFNGRVLTIRRDDLQALAAIIGTTVEDAPQRLAELNLLRDAISG